MNPESNESTRKKLALAQQGDRQAKEELVRENLALVKYLVRRFIDRGKEYDDLYQYGCMGLLKAIERFDLNYDVAFSTYAVPVIIGEIRRFLRDDHPVHVARSIRENARKIERIREESLKEGEDALPVEAIAKKLGISGGDIVLALNACQPVRSLEEPVGQHEDISLQETLGMECMGEVEERILLRDLLNALPEQDRKLLVRRYFYSQTQSQIAQDTGMTQVQVSRREKKIIQRMKVMAGIEV